MRLSPFALAVVLVAITPASAQPVDSATTCTYEACALRVEPHLFGARLVRGAEGETVEQLGLFGPDLSGVVASSPEAVEYARAYERTRTPATLTALGSGVLMGLSLAEVGSDEFQLGAALGGLGLIVISLPLTIRSQRAFSRAIWEYNGDLPRAP